MMCGIPGRDRRSTCESSLGRYCGSAWSVSLWWGVFVTARGGREAVAFGPAVHDYLESVATAAGVAAVWRMPVGVDRFALDPPNPVARHGRIACGVAPNG